MAVDAFIKFEDGKVDRKSHELANDFDRLGDSFTDLGGAFIKLVDDASSTDTNFLKADFAAQIKHDVFTIGADFHKIGDAFIKLAGPLDTFADTVVKFTDQFIKVSDSEPFPLAADFLKFETDIKLTGADFIKAADEGPEENVALNFSQISVDYKEQGNDLLNLSEDFAGFLKAGGISESSKVGESFLKFSFDSVLVSSLDMNLGTDFQKISTDLAGNGDNPPLTLEQAAIKYAGDFIKLGQDLKLADAAFTALGADTIKLTNAIEDTAPVTIPTISKG